MPSGKSMVKAKSEAPKILGIKKEGEKDNSCC